MNRFTRGLAMASARHPWRTIASWVLLMATVFALAGSLAGSFTDDFSAKGSESDRAFWRDAIGGDRISDDDLSQAIGLLRASEALDDTLERARQYGRRAIDALAKFPASKAKAALVEAAEFAVARAY